MSNPPMTKVLVKNPITGIVREFEITDDHVVNPDDVTYEGERSYRKEQFYLMADGDQVLCVVWAECINEAVDIAVDDGRLDAYLMTDEKADEMGKDIDDWEELHCAGNACEMFLFPDTFNMYTFPAPKFSLVRMLGDSVQATRELVDFN